MNPTVERLAREIAEEAWVSLSHYLVDAFAKESVTKAAQKVLEKYWPKLPKRPEFTHGHWNYPGEPCQICVDDRAKINAYDAFMKVFEAEPEPKKPELPEKFTDEQIRWAKDPLLCLAYNELIDYLKANQ